MGAWLRERKSEWTEREREIGKRERERDTCKSKCLDKRVIALK